MNLSEVIARLNAIFDREGNLPVFVGHAFRQIPIGDLPNELAVLRVTGIEVLAEQPDPDNTNYSFPRRVVLHS